MFPLVNRFFIDLSLLYCISHDFRECFFFLYLNQKGRLVNKSLHMFPFVNRFLVDLSLLDWVSHDFKGFVFFFFFLTRRDV